MAKMETSNFERLIGVWETEGTILNDSNHSKLVGVDTYELILDGNFILHKANVKMGEEQSETFEIISFGNSPGKAKFQYFNNRKQTGVMTSSLMKNSFIINGKGIKFKGSINDHNTEIIGKWRLQTETKAWIDFIELRLTKQN